MRFLFKTSPAQDIRLVKHEGQRFWYGLLVTGLMMAPWLIEEYWLAQLTFVLIYSVAGLGLMLLSGYTGLLSLGHAAFLGVGAYTQVFLLNAGVPFLVAMVTAAILAGAVGVVVGLPSLRVKGLYLAIATLSFAFIVEEVLVRWESVTGGNNGVHVKPPSMFGVTLDTAQSFYYLCLLVVVLATLGLLNLLRTPTGRAFIALRDSEVSARSMGIHAARYKAYAFGLGAAMAGLGGALYAHKLRFITPEQFGIHQSIDLLLLIVVGGIGSVHGVFLGAIFLISLPQLIALAKDHFPSGLAESPGMQTLVYGVILVLFVLFEPAGIYGRWLKVRTYFDLFPFYRKGLHKRQKTFQKSERLK